MQLLERAVAAGAEVVHGRVESVEVEGGVKGVAIGLASGASMRIDTNVFVNCAGPFTREAARLVGADVPVFSELHLKIALEDRLGVVDRNTGLVILDDPQTLAWSEDEREELASGDDTRWMTEPMPPGIHLRPEGYHGSTTVLMLWDYHGAQRHESATFPLADDPHYPELVLRGMTRLAPGLQPYVDRLPHCYMDGGYYTKTVENRPLIGPLPVEGAYISAAFSGYGLMAAPAAGELLAAHILSSSLPDYADAFRPDRYESEGYRARIADWGSSGQL
jgi:glycine/D-amino acid oxidase-like deaminating enzyme